MDASILAARRSDGLFHSYNTINFSDNTHAEVTHLNPMLEGQVAVISSGVLDSATVVELVDILFESSLYRSDQNSFLLYPMHIPPSFLERNTLSDALFETHSFLKDDDKNLAKAMHIDVAGYLHFHPHMVNSKALNSTLDTMDITENKKKIIADLYEKVFHHHSYTGRSGSMYGYEGTGSIYWHMVGKLLLAVQEAYWDARMQNADDAVITQLIHSYRRVREGMGHRKSPAQFGAIPTDCYSHTPIHSGAQQPGMTGQVKEGILTRIGELGLRVHAGTVQLDLGLLQYDELFPATGDGIAQFSFCGTICEICRGNAERVTVMYADGTHAEYDGVSLMATDSVELFQRSANIKKIQFTVLS